MSEQRLRPNGRPAPAVPVTRPVGNRPVQPKQQPTQSFEQEENYSRGGYQQPQQPVQPNYNTYQEQPQSHPMGNMGVPPMFNMEDEYESESNKSQKSKLVRNLIFGGIGAVILIGVIFLIMNFVGDDKQVPYVNQNQITEGKDTNLLTKDGSDASVGSVSKDVNFDGSPVPIKWPSDVKPTRMELQLDPTTGKPVLLLVGDKAGLGTVIRSYNQSGELSGYWVIVPDSGENANTEGNASENASGDASATEQSNGQ